jgi:hypothetical protein
MATAGRGLGQEAKDPAACRIEVALLGFGLAVGEQRPAIVVDEVENDLVDRHSPQATVHLQSADHLVAKNPDIVAVPPQCRARQLLGQQVTQERHEVFDQPQARWRITRFVRPAP